MKIVATPMCKEVLKMAGITEFIVNKNPDEEQADLAIVLSETETKMESVKVKLNTFSQIEDSVIQVYNIFNQADYSKNHDSNFNQKLKILKEDIESKIDSKWLNSEEKINLKNINRKIKVRVYSNFLKDIIEDMGYQVVPEKPDFVVYPDYLENDIECEIRDYNSIKIPSHGGVPLNPVERAHIRYNILEKKLCMKP
jgi:segregation and condensation protein B